jgi:hypothetical protein
MVSCDVFGMEEGIQVAFGEPVGGQASGLGAGGVSDTLGSGAGRVGGPVDLERGQATAGQLFGAELDDRRRDDRVRPKGR